MLSLFSCFSFAKKPIISGLNGEIHFDNFILSEIVLSLKMFSSFLLLNLDEFCTYFQTLTKSKKHARVKSVTPCLSLPYTSMKSMKKTLTRSNKKSEEYIYPYLLLCNTMSLLDVLKEMWITWDLFQPRKKHSNGLIKEIKHMH